VKLLHWLEILLVEYWALLMDATKQLQYQKVYARQLAPPRGRVARLVAPKSLSFSCHLARPSGGYCLNSIIANLYRMFIKIKLAIIGLLTCFVCSGADGGGIVPEPFNKMLDSYRNASVFSCEGDISTGAKGSQVQNKKTFKLSFERPDRFNLELVETDPISQQTKTNRVFTLQGRAYSQIAPSLQPKEETSLYEALRTCRGASAGMSESIPFLLIGTNVFSMDAFTQQPDAQLDGMDCLHFSALTARKQPIEVFIDQKDFFILKLKRTFKIDAKQIPANAPNLQKLLNSEFETTTTFRKSKFN